MDNGKAVLTLHRLNEHFSELNEVVNNSNLKVKNLGQKRLHINPKSKGRLALNFIHKKGILEISNSHYMSGVSQVLFDNV